MKNKKHAYFLFILIFIKWSRTLIIKFNPMLISDWLIFWDPNFLLDDFSPINYLILIGCFLCFKTFQLDPFYFN